MKTRQPIFLLCFSLIFFLLVSCGSPSARHDGWVMVYRHNAEGESLAGNKDHLMAAVRNGLPVRIGFGVRGQRDTTRSVEHLADVQFLTILDNNEVFGQIEQIIGQSPVRDEGGAKIRFRSNNKWTMIAGTNGYFSSLMVDFLANELVNPSSDAKRGASWFVYYHGKTSAAVKPFYD